MKPQRRWSAFVCLMAIALVWVLGTGWFLSPTRAQAPVTDYDRSAALKVNQLDYFPLAQTLAPKHYLPVGEWGGRLILPTEEETTAQPGDWVWLELYQVPKSDKFSIGDRVQLTWQKDNQRLKDYINLVTTDVTFSPAAQRGIQQGNVLPTRLNGRKQVGPLQSLAGARPQDDVTVVLGPVTVTEFGNNQTQLAVTAMPTVVTGRYRGLVKFVAPAGVKNPVCPGISPCDDEFWQVRHYNKTTQKFDGPLETIRVPQQPRLSGERRISSPVGLDRSPWGEQGWYVYGAQGQDGLFTVQALEPRSFFTLDFAGERIPGNQRREYLLQENWQDTPQRKGTAQRVWVEGQDLQANAGWQEGDHRLMMHLFGGIGGERGEKITLGMVTGHFSFGVAEVVRDPLTEELRWQIIYDQVYAHNPQGILAAHQSWANYAGSLQRGWIFSRPFSDVLIDLDLLEDYEWGPQSISPLDELTLQLEIMMARYRTGDGKGFAAVTPAASCVQDSNQALFIAINRLETRFATPTDRPSELSPASLERLQRLQTLGDRLLAVLKPRGIARSDWAHNAQTLAGTEGVAHPLAPFTQQDTLDNGLVTWFSMMPRVSHDALGQIFGEQGAGLGFWRTNQGGGEMPEILPLAPTSLFGDSPFLAPLARKVIGSLVLLPTGSDWLKLLLALITYGAIAVPLGVFQSLITWQPQPFSGHLVKQGFGLALMPAFGEELLFRVLLLPFPSPLTPWTPMIVAIVLSLILFVVYHPLLATTLYPPGRPLFYQPRFLLPAGLLGLWATVLYASTGSLLLITLFHWVIVGVWILILGGQARLRHP